LFVRYFKICLYFKRVIQIRSTPSKVKIVQSYKSCSKARNAQSDGLTPPYQKSVSSKRIQLVDDQFKEEDFVQLCHNHSDKKVYWIKWDESKFWLQQIYNPDFYMEQKFKKIEKNQPITQETKEDTSDENLLDKKVERFNKKEPFTQETKEDLSEKELKMNKQ